MEKTKNINMEWFKDWFNSKYYHILYKNRNESEATLLLKSIIQTFKPINNDVFLDLGCGSGRHAIYLNQQGFQVDGIDLSENSLKKAKEYQNKRLNFYLEDMRYFTSKNRYSFILNLFTSFGYFENQNDNKKIFSNVDLSLQKNGYFILDFFNSTKVISELKDYEIKKIDNIHFEIKKKYDDNFVYKEICVIDKKNKYTFTRL